MINAFHAKSKMLNASQVRAMRATLICDFPLRYFLRGFREILNTDSIIQ